MTAAGEPDPIAVCIGCGCDDLHACMTQPLPVALARPEPCHWLRVDRDAGLGVCSACPGSVERWDAGDRDLDDLRLLTEGPDDDLGPCCICAGTTGVRNVIMLHVKGRVPGHGWGCFGCDLPCDGASAVLCDPCAEAWQKGTPLRFACRGFPAEDGRVPIEELAEPHAHDMAKHAGDADESLRCRWCDVCGRLYLNDGEAHECAAGQQRAPTPLPSRRPWLLGPGRYDDEVTALRERYHAHGVILIVMGGDRGEGFSMQASLETTLRLPEILEHIAAQIREDRSRIISPDACRPVST